MNPNTMALMNQFTTALFNKVEAAELKYGYRDNWRADDWEQECRQKMMEHIEKGDPLDVAAYCAFMWKRGWPITPPSKRLFTAEVTVGPVTTSTEDVA